MADMAASGKNALVVFSLAMLALLGCGFVGQIGVGICKTGTLYHERGFLIESGQVECFSISSTTRLRQHGESNIRPILQFWPPSPLDIRKALFEFNARPLPGSPPGQHEFLLSCPIWFASLPFLIALAWWLQKRRRTEAARFTVIVSDEKSI